jgi:hypothetical protein
MRIETKLSNCWIRSWETDDKLDLVQNRLKEQNKFW